MENNINSDQVLFNRIRPEYSHTNINPQGKYILYWMQSAQRYNYNHCLYFAAKVSKFLKQNVVTVFFLDRDYPDANKHHFDFLIQNLLELQNTFLKKNIKLLITDKSQSTFMELCKDASVIITENPWMKYDKNWKNEYFNKISQPHYFIETNSVIPYYAASQKEEYSAGIFRRKITPILHSYLTNFKIPKIHDYSNFDVNNIILKLEKHSRKIFKEFNSKTSKYIKSGENAAKTELNFFIKNKIKYYEEKRNEPSENYYSNMSPYLHFGQISPLFIALQIMDKSPEHAEKYLDELIVRRELSINFINYNPNYDKFSCLPNWALKTLYDNKIYDRPYLYSLKQFENAQTHDKYWNSAQKEMVIRGKMHAYMRMYWGKKILEWSKDPEEAFYTALYLNNKYSLDGRDPNSFASVAWCFGKHDRAWPERKIFGKVRYMNENGLKRKFNIEKYVDKINSI